MTTITVAKGDGIGPEIMDAVLSIIKAAGADIARRNRSRREGLPGRQYIRHCPGIMGCDPEKQSISESTHYHTAGRGI
jgi:isocitrate/isopropylmalate dehydrogenase